MQKLSTKHFASLGMLIGLILITLGEIKAFIETEAYNGPSLVIVGFFLFVFSVLMSQRKVLIEALQLLFRKQPY